MPGLHISLGIFYRLFELLEDRCKQLDLALAQDSSQPDSLHSFRLYSAALHKVAKLEEELRNDTEEAEAAEQLSTFLALKEYPQSQVNYCRDAATKLRQHIANLVCDLFNSKENITQNLI